MDSFIMNEKKTRKSPHQISFCQHHLVSIWFWQEACISQGNRETKALQLILHILRVVRQLLWNTAQFKQFPFLVGLVNKNRSSTGE